MAGGHAHSGADRRNPGQPARDESRQLRAAHRKPARLGDQPGAATRNTAWLRSTADIDEAERWGRGLASLEAVWPAANLSLVMRAPSDPVASKGPYEKLDDPARPELPHFITYLTACTPVLSANDGSEVDAFLALRGEGALPQTYRGRVNHVRTYHHFTKGTLDALVNNEAFPQWKQQSFFFRALVHN